MDIKARAKALKADIPAVFLALRDPETPAAAKVLAALAVGCALSPIDLIPDFIPVLGYLDDVLLLPALIALTVRLIPREVWARSQASARDLWRDGGPKAWYFAIPVAAVWVLLLILAARAVCG